MDYKIARGITRSLTAAFETGGALMERAVIDLVAQTASRSVNGRCNHPRDFNPAAAAFAAAVRSNPSAIGVRIRHMTEREPGRIVMLSLRSVTVVRHRWTGPFESKEWGVVADHVLCAKKRFEYRTWVLPVTFDPHLVERFVFRMDTKAAAPDREGTLETLRATMLDAAVAAAAFARTSTFAPRPGAWPVLDVAAPAPGGAFCGGSEPVFSGHLGFALGGTVTKGRPEKTVSRPDQDRPTLCLSYRTFMDTNILDGEQRDFLPVLKTACDLIREEAFENPDAVLGWPLAASGVGWNAEATAATVASLFGHWRRKSRREGIARSVGRISHTLPDVRRILEQQPA